MIIDDDPKIRKEMLQYLKELSFEEIHEFSTSTEFEKAFLQSLFKKASAAPQANPLGELSPEIAKFLTAAPFAQTKPFSEEKANLVIDFEKLQIVQVSEKTIFGKTSGDLVSKNTPLQSLVPAEYHAIFKAHLESIKGRGEKTVNMAFKNEKNEIWLIDVTGTCDGKHYTLTLIDKTVAAAQVLGKKITVAEEQKKKPLDLILFRYTCLQTKDLKKWVTNTTALLKQANLWPAEFRPKFIAVRYENDPNEKAEFNHPFIDDLLCLPLDRLVFLQKIDLALGLPKKNSPQFLFVQEANDTIEIAKKVTLERISDLGFALVNPVPLAFGTVGHFYFRFPKQAPLLDIYGKAQISIPHPERPGQHLVYFNFFGLNRNMNKEVKTYLAKDSNYKSLVDQSKENFKYNPENIFLTEAQKRRKTIALIDIDEASIKNTVDILKEIGNIDIISDDTYYGFFKKHLAPHGDDDKIVAAKAEDFYRETISILIGAMDMKLQMALTPPSPTDCFLGHNMQKMLSDPQGWLNLFSDDSRNLLTECLYLITTTKRVNRNFELKTEKNEKKTVAVEFILEDNAQNIRLNFKPADPKFLVKTDRFSRIDSLDCLIINYAVLPENVEAFINGLKEAAVKANIQTPPDGPRIIVMIAENQKVDFDKLLQSKIFGLIYKPVEIRRLLYLVAQATETPFCIYTFENIGWKSEVISAKISRTAQLVELSEFGATIKSKQALKPGTMLYLFKSIFDNAPDRNLCVRVYHSEEDESEEGSYLNSVVYFGITDAFLKFTRAYIRETYAAKKAKEGGGA